MWKGRSIRNDSLKRLFSEIKEKADALIDFGSGGGKILRFARNYGMQSVGFEQDKKMVQTSRMDNNIHKDIIEDTVDIIEYISVALKGKRKVAYIYSGGLFGHKLIQHIIRILFSVKIEYACIILPLNEISGDAKWLKEWEEMHEIYHRVVLTHVANKEEEEKNVLKLFEENSATEEEWRQYFNGNYLDSATMAAYIYVRSDYK